MSDDEDFMQESDEEQHVSLWPTPTHALADHI